jgi:hypothetical protein
MGFRCGLLGFGLRNCDQSGEKDGKNLFQHWL